MSLYALVQLHQQEIFPERLSCASILLAYRRMLRDYLHPVEPGNNLCQQLCLAVIDGYEPTNKSSRDYPRKKQESQPGKPTIRVASKTQIHRAQSLPTMTEKG